MNLQCSHWEPVERTVERIPVVIYMHGNASARVEVLPQLTVLLSLGVAVFAFDFAGSGKSDGDHVTLGYFEREDLLCVVAHLRATDVVSTIALWGRSMGAGAFFFSFFTYCTIELSLFRRHSCVEVLDLIPASSRPCALVVSCNFFLANHPPIYLKSPP